MGKFSATKIALMVFAFCATVVVAPAQTFTSLFSFNGTDGANPNYGSLVQAANGNFYGTTEIGGINGWGTVFEITPKGGLKTLHDFNYTDGGGPIGGLVQAPDGNFYGTTSTGGAYGNDGTIFEITPTGKLTTLYSFCAQTNCADGQLPEGGLMQANNGALYGTTVFGGANFNGSVFKFTPGGKLTTLYSFCSQTNCTDGSTPTAAPVQASNGNLFGTTYSGGAHGYGTVFEITPAGKLTTLYSFCSQTTCSDGQTPLAGLMVAANGSLYGTTHLGGTGLYGTLFEITLTGQLTTLYNFCLEACTNGVYPQGLVQATDGNIYGTTNGGGTYGWGSVFQFTPSGTLTTLYSFCPQTNCALGSAPTSGLSQGTDGGFYGTTYSGGSSSDCIYGCGTVFSLSLGLGPFVETRPTSGKAGARVIVLGNNLSGTTGVTFNGTPANFMIVSNTAISTTVPIGATTGTVKVTTPGGTLNSNIAFRVMP